MKEEVSKNTTSVKDEINVDLRNMQEVIDEIQVKTVETMSLPDRSRNICSINLSFRESEDIKKEADVLFSSGLKLKFQCTSAERKVAQSINQVYCLSEK